VRLHIIGIPSAGKTTLGTSMSRLLNAPHHDLDDLAFVMSAGH
jgi:shikimate kinase